MVWTTWLAVGGLPLLLFSLGFVVGCFERLPVRQFEPADSCDPRREHPYIRETTTTGVTYGLLFLAEGRHTKYGDKLRAVLLCSPDCATLVLIGAGTIVGLPTKKTILIRRLRDGGFLYTIDDPGACELDPMTRRQILIKAKLPEMLDEHRLMLDSLGGSAPFPVNSDWSTLDIVYQERTERIVRAGLGKYTDDSKSAYRKTVVGSFRASIIHGIGQIFRPKNIARSMGVT